MDSGRTVSGRRKVGAMFMLTGLLGGLFAVLAPTVSAEPLPSGTLGLFENEGDQDDATLNTGNIDWETVKTDPRITEWKLIHDDGDPDVADFTFLDSAKEQDPSTWACAANESPPKDDIYRLYLASQIRADAQFLHIGYVRATATGDTDINLEFNQVSGQFSCPGDTGGRVRTRDDLMLSFTFGGGSDPSVINVYRWDPTAAADSAGDPAPSVTGSDFVPGDGHWDLVALAPNNAVGADNSTFGDEKDEALIRDQFFDDSLLEPRTFGEITLDLGAIFSGGLLNCPGFGFVTGHSRASHSFASDLKDIFPETRFDLSDCAKIRIKKVDNSVPPVAQQGAIYGLYDSLAKAQAVASQTDEAAKAAAVSWCTTGADGTCLLTKADPDSNYWITEIAPPAGLLPSTEIRAVSAADLVPFGTLDLTSAPFVNNVPVGSVTITKRLFNDANQNNVLDPGEQITPDQMTDLDGIRFTLQQGGVTSKTHPANTDATCVISGGTGQCTISSVRLGTYQILETLNPSGPSGIGLGTSPSVTITTNGQTVTANYDNPLSPINIALDKVGDRDQANIGDTVNYTFTVTTTGVRLHNVTLVEWEGVLGPVTYADICDSGPTFDAALSTGEGDGFLDAGDAFVWKCPHLVTGTDPDPLPNRARAAGIDDVGRSAEAYDIFNVDILYPDLQVVKQAADGVDAGTGASADETIDAPGTATYTVTVTNVGTGIARNATLTDTLPPGTWTVSLASADGDDVCPVGGSPKSGSFTCTFGDLAAGASKVITVSRAVTIANDCAAVLVNNAGVTTTYLQVDIDPNSANDTSSATIRVRCPISIDLDKTGDTLAHVGDVVDYEFTVTNTGGEDLLDVALTDPECDEGTISLIDNRDGDAVLAAGVWDAELEAFVDGEAWAYACERTLTAADVVLIDGADFALNTGSVRGEDADGREVTDTDPHVVEVITPAILVVKTVDDDTPALGQTVTFTYVVTNTGDTTLFGVDVVDDQLGAIGTIPELAAGASATLTKTMVVAATSPTRNVATATGDDVLGKTVTDDDDATITIVLGEVITRKPAVLPRTGVDSDRLLLISGLFLLFGGLLLASSEGWAMRTVRRRQG